MSWREPEQGSGGRAGGERGQTFELSSDAARIRLPGAGQRFALTDGGERHAGSGSRASAWSRAAPCTPQKGHPETARRFAGRQLPPGFTSAHVQGCSRQKGGESEVLQSRHSSSGTRRLWAPPQPTSLLHHRSYLFSPVGTPHVRPTTAVTPRPRHCVHTTSQC